MSKLKRILLVIPVVILGLTFAGNGVVAHADEGQRMSVDLAPNSYVDGSDSNRYYHLTTGSCSLQVTEFSGDNADVYLRRERTGPDKQIDTIRVTGTGWYRFDGVDSDSYNYYLYVISHGASSVHIAGYMHDHRP